MTRANAARQTHRKPIAETVLVEDSIHEAPLGRIGHVSQDELMLICAQPLQDDAIYQIRFTLPGDKTAMEVGIHEQWSQPAGVPGQHWVGLRIIAISADDEARLARWLATA